MYNEKNTHKSKETTNFVGIGYITDIVSVSQHI